MNIDQITVKILTDHFPFSRGKAANVLEFENRTGCQLPLDMSYFYSRVDGARLFDDKWPPYVLLPIHRVCQVATLILGETPADNSTSRWYAFCDVQDGNFIAADLGSVDGDKCDILDCFHETFPERVVIASSFESFLLSTLASDGTQFWLR